MIRDAVERVYSVVNSNFATQLATLLTAASLPALTPMVFKRRSAERFYAHTACGVGVYHEGGTTSRRKPGAASGSGIRDSRPILVLDFYLRGTTEADVEQQTEVAIQALLRSVDAIPTTGVFSAGDGPGSVTWEIISTPLSEDRTMAESRALIRFPVVVRETGL